MIWQNFWKNRKIFLTVRYSDENYNYEKSFDKSGIQMVNVQQTWADNLTGDRYSSKTRRLAKNSYYLTTTILG